MYIREICKTGDIPSGADDYLNNIPAIAALKKLRLDKAVTFLVGENGSGKSTLLEAVAVCFGFNAEGGTRNFNFSSRNTHSGLYRYLTLVKEPVMAKDGFFLRAESFYNAASYIDEVEAEGSYGGRSLHAQSHGESFLSLVMNRFSGHGFYVLDEPEAALSPSRQMSLLCRIHDLAENGSQFLIATHSPILMAYPDADIYLLDENGIKKTRYEETEHYQIMKQFLNNTQRMIDMLFSEE